MDVKFMIYPSSLPTVCVYIQHLGFLDLARIKTDKQIFLTKLIFFFTNKAATTKGWRQKVMHQLTDIIFLFNKIVYFLFMSSKPFKNMKCLFLAILLFFSANKSERHNIKQESQDYNLVYDLHVSQLLCIQMLKIRKFINCFAQALGIYNQLFFLHTGETNFSWLTSNKEK